MAELMKRQTVEATVQESRLYIPAAEAPEWLEAGETYRIDLPEQPFIGSLERNMSKTRQFKTGPWFNGTTVSEHDTIAVQIEQAKAGDTDN